MNGFGSGVKSTGGYGAKTNGFGGGSGPKTNGFSNKMTNSYGGSSQKLNGHTNGYTNGSKYLYKSENICVFFHDELFN